MSTGVANEVVQLVAYTPKASDPVSPEAALCRYRLPSYSSVEVLSRHPSKADADLEYQEGQLILPIIDGHPRYCSFWMLEQRCQP